MTALAAPYGWAITSSTTNMPTGYTGTMGGAISTASAPTGEHTCAITQLAQTWTVWSRTIVTSAAETYLWPSWLEAAGTVDNQPAYAERANPCAERQILVAAGERLEARHRAEKLLQEALSEQQRLELREHGYFTVHALPVGGQPGRAYRIRRGRERNIDKLSPAGLIIGQLCIHPVAAVPDADTMLAQKLWLESRESEALRIANHS